MGKRGWIKEDEEIIRFAKQNDEISNKGTYKNLMIQVNKIARHAKGVSITSQRQYYNHIDNFVRYISDEFGLKSLKNISGKHLAAYIEERQSEGKSPSTVKNDIAAIRYYHDQMEKTRHFFPNNTELKEKYNISLEKRMFGNVNRRWSETEYQKMLNVAYQLKRPEIAHIVLLGREQGLRIHEVVRMSRTDAENALRTGFLVVKGKGGLVRSVPLQTQTKSVLAETMRNVSRGHKLFVPEGKKTHEVIQSVQGFIKRHRDNITDSTERKTNVNMTFHGLRHSYSYDQYQSLIKNGVDPQLARYKVSELIGHSRDDVTRIYLAE